MATAEMGQTVLAQTIVSEPSGQSVAVLFWCHLVQEFTLLVAALRVSSIPDGPLAFTPSAGVAPICYHVRH